MKPPDQYEKLDTVCLDLSLYTKSNWIHITLTSDLSFTTKGDFWNMKKFSYQKYDTWREDMMGNDRRESHRYLWSKWCQKLLGGNSRRVLEKHKPFLKNTWSNQGTQIYFLKFLYLSSMVITYFGHQSVCTNHSLFQTIWVIRKSVPFPFSNHLGNKKESIFKLMTFTTWQFWEETSLPEETLTPYVER